MAIAFVSKTAFTFGTGTTISYSQDCTGANILFVGVTTTTGKTISSITYNGVSMTQSGSTSGTAGVINSLYYLVSPATGSNTVSITQSAGGNITSSSICYSGASTTGQPDATSVGGPTSTTSYSQSVTSVADNCFAVLYGDANGGLTLTAGSNTTVRNQPEVAFTGAFLVDSTALKTPAGTFTLAVTSGSQSFAGCMASFKPASAVVYTASFTTGSYTYSGVDFIVTKVGQVYTASFTTGVYAYTGNDFIVNFSGWTYRDKNTATWTFRNK
jgi:hypothetical protein